MGVSPGIVDLLSLACLGILPCPNTLVKSSSRFCLSDSVYIVSSIRCARCVIPTWLEVWDDSGVWEGWGVSGRITHGVSVGSLVAFFLDLRLFSVLDFLLGFHLTFVAISIVCMLGL